MGSSFRFFLAFLMLSGVLVGGTLGYYFIEGSQQSGDEAWTLSDCLYMTVITITTVGYGEVHKLSPEGRQFTMLLLLLSVLTAGYSVTTVIGFVFEGQILDLMRGRRMEKKLASMKDHYIICGCGVVGKEVATELRRAEVPFVVVERDPEHSEMARDASVLFVEGNAEDDETLMEAGIKRARGLVAALRQDESNVFVVLTARELNPDLTIVARAAEASSVSKLQRAGANRVISPYEIAGRRIASVILRPSVVHFLDVLVESGQESMHLEEVRIGTNSPMANKALGASGLGQHTGAIVVGILGPDGQVRYNASENKTLSSVVLRAGDVLISLGNQAQINTLKAFAEGTV